MVPWKAASSATISAREAPAAPAAAPDSATGKPSSSGTYTAAATTLAQFRHSSVRACRLDAQLPPDVRHWIILIVRRASAIDISLQTST